MSCKDIERVIHACLGFLFVGFFVMLQIYFSNNKSFKFILIRSYFISFHETNHVGPLSLVDKRVDF